MVAAKVGGHSGKVSVHRLHTTVVREVLSLIFLAHSNFDLHAHARTPSYPHPPITMTTWDREGTEKSMYESLKSEVGSNLPLCSWCQTYRADYLTVIMLEIASATTPVYFCSDRCRDKFNVLTEAKSLHLKGDHDRIKELRLAACKEMHDKHYQIRQDAAHYIGAVKLWDCLTADALSAPPSPSYDPGISDGSSSEEEPSSDDSDPDFITPPTSPAPRKRKRGKASTMQRATRVRTIEI